MEYFKKLLLFELDLKKKKWIPREGFIYLFMYLLFLFIYLFITIYVFQKELQKCTYSVIR